MKLEEEDWKVVWLSFINHNIYNEHSHCRHPTLPEDYETNFSYVSPAATQALQDLLESTSHNACLFLHGTHTNGNKAANGMAHARANKRLFRTVTGRFFYLYSPFNSPLFLWISADLFQKEEQLWT